LSHNNLIGSIPKELGMLSVVTNIDISSNNLMREVPEELSDCFKLESLNLSNNKLCGKIPSHFGNLVSIIDFLDLSSNFNGRNTTNTWQLEQLAKS
jgi:Leucine-rich repeat (LRR) protein